MRPAAAVTAAAGLLLLLTGCVRYYEVRTDEVEAPPAYLQAVRSHSSTGKVFAPLTPRFEAGATFETPEFKSVLRRELARVQSRPLEAVEVEARPTVVLFLDSTRRKEEDITRRDKTFWVGLETGGARWEPEVIQLLESDMPLPQHLFPYVNTFGRAYRLVFPESVVLNRGETELVVSGAPGELRLPFR